MSELNGRIKNVVFDLGGVVLGRNYDEVGARLRPFAFLQGDREFPWWWKDFDRGTVEMAVVQEQIALAENCSLEEAARHLDTITGMFDEFPQTVQLIEELSGKGYPLYVLSNMPREIFEVLRQKPVFRYFDGMVISSHEKLIKPDPEIFNILLRRYSLVPQETLFVDDKPSNTAAARSLGFKVYTFEPRSGCSQVRELLGLSI